MHSTKRSLIFVSQIATNHVTQYQSHRHGVIISRCFTASCIRDEQRAEVLEGIQAKPPRNQNRKGNAATTSVENGQILHSRPLYPGLEPIVPCPIYHQPG